MNRGVGPVWMHNYVTMNYGVSSARIYHNCLSDYIRHKYNATNH